MSNICPACEQGKMTPQVMAESFPYDGVELTISKYEFSLCPVCSEEFVLPDQARRNEVRFADAKRAHDGLLTSQEIIVWRRRWELTQQHAAALLGGGVNAFSKYERGEVTQARSMDLLIRASDKLAELRAFLSEIAGVGFGEEWVSVPDEMPEQRAAAPARTAVSCTVSDIVMYRMRQAELHESAKNDGWHAEEGLELDSAYG